MNATQIPEKLENLIGAAAEVHGSILIYHNDVVVFANTAARELHSQQDWSGQVTFGGIFRTAIEGGRITDPIILKSPEAHLAYATMARAREPSFQFRRDYDGHPYDRYHTAVDCDWNAQIWVPVRRNVLDEDGEPPFDLLEQVKRKRALSTMTSMFERMGIALAVVNAQGRLIDNSPLMIRHLRTGELFERDLGNKIACHDPASTARLRSVIESVATGRQEAALIPVPATGGAQLVAVMPAPTDGLAVVLVQGAAQPEPLQELLVSAYGLTPRQAEVAIRVAGGETAEEIATALDRKFETVRQQIATSKAKISAGRTQDLACIVTRAAALFGGFAPAETQRRGKQ